MKLVIYLKNNRGFTLIELLVSITIFGIVLLSFMNFFLQSSTYTNLNQKKTVGVNVARNALMYMENQDFLETRDFFYDVNSGNQDANDHFLHLFICNDEYSTYSDKLSETEINQSCPDKKNININGLEYETTIYSEQVINQNELNYYIPITIKVRWNINDKEHSTTVDGKVKSEDIR
ncbi:type II secretion system protein [Bacillus sp. RO3]|nr:type II secretion system protein [Bacillus sp. RO3]